MRVAKLTTILEQHPLRNQLIRHPFFTELEESPLTRADIARLVGQWWHPLHYFPTFLSRLIAVSESLTIKVSSSRILFQELGEGDPARAHEVVFQQTMRDVGIAPSQATGAEASVCTAALVSGYMEASRTELEGVAFLYATEVADLSMVSALGTAIRRVTGAVALPWVDIHVAQEPDHVYEAEQATSLEFDDLQMNVLIATAARCWTLWSEFFAALAAETASAHACQPGASAQTLTTVPSMGVIGAS